MVGLASQGTFSELYQPTHAMTVFAQPREAMVWIRSGIAIKAFQASQQASRISSYVLNTRLLR